MRRESAYWAIWACRSFILKYLFSQSYETCLRWSSGSPTSPSSPLEVARRTSCSWYQGGSCHQISIHPQSPANQCNGSCRLYLSTVTMVLVIRICLHSPLCCHHSDKTLNKLWQKILDSPTSSGGLPATERLLFSTSKPRILEMTLLIADYMNMMGVVNLPKTSTRSTIHSRSVSRSRLQVGKHKMLTNRKIITSAV